MRLPNTSGLIKATKSATLQRKGGFLPFQLNETNIFRPGCSWCIIVNLSLQLTECGQSWTGIIFRGNSIFEENRTFEAALLHRLFLKMLATQRCAYLWIVLTEMDEWAECRWGGQRCTITEIYHMVLQFATQGQILHSYLGQISTISLRYCHLINCSFLCR